MKESGADANAADKTGRTTVMWAARAGHTATAVALVRTVLWESAAGGEGAAVGSMMTHAGTRHW